MTFSLRACAARDADAIGLLAAEFHAHLLAVGDASHFDWGGAQYLRDGFGDDPAFDGVVAEVGTQVAGYALYHPGYDTNLGQRYLYLIDLFVSQAFRRRGIATALMERVAEIGLARGAELIAWSVHKANHAAVRFYESAGGRYERDVHIMWCPIPHGREPIVGPGDT